MEASAPRLLAAGGIAFAACLVLASVAPTDGGRGMLLGLASAGLLCFVGALHARLRPAGAARPFANAAALAGCAVAVLYALAAAEVAAPELAQVQPPEREEPAELDPILFALLFPQAVLLGSVAAAIRSTGLLGGGLGTGAALAASFQLLGAVLMAGTGSTAAGVAIGLASFVLWVLAAGVLLVRERPL